MQLPQETRSVMKRPVVREHKQAEAPLRKVSTFAKSSASNRSLCGARWRLMAAARRQRRKEGKKGKCSFCPRN
ncbi:hypothetical protein CEXT_289301 [Caerostris extrusa]|uniref:Uncharacterized protein n=1 Tax=Caerostris extrusa TaxID=172846 RepID=A0AAV4RRD0_CAEEX|nr:hypothetical protein CEXT_289301 [Caerostris extrusa]